MGSIVNSSRFSVALFRFESKSLFLRRDYALSMQSMPFSIDSSIDPSLQKGKRKISRAAKIRIPTNRSREQEILFGIHPVKEAMRQGRRRLFRLYLKHEFELNSKLREIAVEAENQNLPVDVVGLGDLDRLTDLDKFNNFRPHQGVCLDCSPLTTNPTISTYTDFISSIPLSSQWLFPILVDVKDPMNFGAILRSSLFFGVDHLLLLGGGGMRRVSPVVSKASSGAAEVARLFRIEDGVAFLTEAKEMGDTILGTAVPPEEEEEVMDDDAIGDLPASRASSISSRLYNNDNDDNNKMTSSPSPAGVTLYDGETGEVCDVDAASTLPPQRRSSPTFLLFGSEGRGLDPDLLRLCHFHVCINSSNVRISNVDSLNVSVASGIILHHFLC